LQQRPMSLSYRGLCIDYVTDVAGGIASHYCYDPKSFSGLVFPTPRRAVKRTADGPRLSGITGVFLDYTAVQIHDRIPGLDRPSGFAGGYSASGDHATC
jgi:hypothetical protein